MAGRLSVVTCARERILSVCMCCILLRARTVESPRREQKETSSDVRSVDARNNSATAASPTLLQPRMQRKRRAGNLPSARFRIARSEIIAHHDKSIEVRVCSFPSAASVRSAVLPQPCRLNSIRQRSTDTASPPASVMRASPSMRSVRSRGQATQKRRSSASLPKAVGSVEVTSVAVWRHWRHSLDASPMSSGERRMCRMTSGQSTDHVSPSSADCCE